MWFIFSILMFAWSHRVIMYIIIPSVPHIFKPYCLHVSPSHTSLSHAWFHGRWLMWTVGSFNAAFTSCHRFGVVSEERRQARKTVWPVHAGSVVCCYKNSLYRIPNPQSPWTCIRFLYESICRRFKHNHNEPYRHWCQDGGWLAFSIVMDTTAWHREF